MPERQLAQQLRQIIAQYGPQLADEPRRASALLRDLCAKHKPGEVRVLAAVAEEGLARDLMRDGGKTSQTILLPRLAKRLHDELGVDRDLALWAVTAWAEALERTAPTPHAGEAASPAFPSPQIPSSHHQPLASYGSDARPRIGQTGRYLDNGDGTVTDVKTGLQWMRCSLAQTWDGSGCTGNAEFYTWDAAMSSVDELNRSGGYAGYRDWRMPTVEELTSLVYHSGGYLDTLPFAESCDHGQHPEDFPQPTIDLEAFPDTEPSFFWSASPYANYSGFAWYVNFKTGYDYWTNKLVKTRIRLVRGGQSEAADAVSPQPQSLASHDTPHARHGRQTRPRIGQTGRYRDNGDGTVTDIETGLQWKRCSLGQTWDGKRCAGKAKGYNWQEALSATDELNRSGGYAGHSDWRVPTVEELNSLVYCSSGDPGIFPFARKRAYWFCKGDFQHPTIDVEAFPDTEPSFFWSASPHNRRSANAWGVYFFNGYGGRNNKGFSFLVRLVRDGQ